MFEVRWTDLAIENLAEIWLLANDKNAVNGAVNRIDALLKYEPHDVGESRGGSERLGFVPPLVVRFLVSDEDRRVDVLTVRAIRR